jgi:hypothetical protein
MSSNSLASAAAIGVMVWRRKKSDMRIGRKTLVELA